MNTVCFEVSQSIHFVAVVTTVGLFLLGVHVATERRLRQIKEAKEQQRKQHQ